jgi:hypothetical protein
MPMTALGVGWVAARASQVVCAPDPPRHSGVRPVAGWDVVSRRVARCRPRVSVPVTSHVVRRCAVPVV